MTVIMGSMSSFDQYKKDARFYALDLEVTRMKKKLEKKIAKGRSNSRETVPSSV